MSFQIDSTTLQQSFRQAKLLDVQTGLANEGLLVTPKGVEPPIFFKAPLQQTDEQKDRALQEALHHQDVYQSLNQQARELIPAYFGQLVTETEPQKIVLAMEKLDAISILEKIKTGNMTWQEAFNYYKNTILPMVFTLIDSGFYHTDPHPSNVMITEEGKPKLVDIDTKNTFLISKDKNEALSGLLTHRNNIALHIKHKNTLNQLDESEIKEVLKQFALADLKRAFLSYRLLFFLKKNELFRQGVPTKLNKNNPNSLSKKIVSTILTYQPFYNLDGKTFPKRIMDWVRR